MRTPQQVIELIKKPLSADQVKAAKDAFIEHRRHVTGEGSLKYLEETDIAGFETKESKALRCLLHKPSTLPILSEALLTFEKVFSASGFSMYHDFDGNDNLRKDFEAYLASPIADGYSLRKWMHDVWGKKIHYDFMGVAMVELPVEQTTDRPAPYVIFKSISCIKDWKIKDGKLVYLLYEMRTEMRETVNGKQEKVELYRYIDEDIDIIIEEVNGKYKPSERYPEQKNTLGRVPGVFISTNRKDGGDIRTSYIDKAIPVCDDYLLDASIHRIAKKQHGFAQPWMYEQKCSTCSGTGEIIVGQKEVNGTLVNETSKCTASGCVAGNVYTMRPDKVIIKPIPDANNPDIADPGGFVTPPIDSLKNQVEEMDRLQRLINTAIWQHESFEGEQKADTATGRMLDASSYQTKLNRVSDNAEYVEGQLIYMLGKYRYGNLYKGTSDNWGRKYYILNETQLEQQYKAAKEAGASASVLRSYLEEWVYTKYATDKVELNRQLRLLEVEPMSHLTVDEVEALKSVTQSDKMLKAYFNDYIAVIDKTQPDLITSPDIEPLVQRLRELNTQKMIDAGLIDAEGNAISADSRAELRGTVGGMTAATALAVAVGGGQTTPEAAARQLEYFFGMDYNQALLMVGTQITTPSNNQQFN